MTTRDEAPLAIARSAAGPGDAEGARYIYVEVAGGMQESDAWGGDAVRDRRAERVVTAAKDLLGEGVELARACAARFSSGLAQLPDGVTAPDEVELQLGITLDTELGALLAKATAGAQLQVTLTWRQKG